MSSRICRTRVSELPPRSYPTLVDRVDHTRVHLSQVARTLDDLCALGLVEKFKDEYGIVRFRRLRQTEES